MIIKHFMHALLTITIVLTVCGCAGGPTQEQLALEHQKQKMCEQSISEAIAKYKTNVTTYAEVLNDIQANGWYIEMNFSSITSPEGKISFNDTIIKVGCNGKCYAELTFKGDIDIRNQTLYDIKSYSASTPLSQNHMDENALHSAFYYPGNTSIIQAELDADGSSPLIAACTFGRKEVVRALLDKGADVNAKNNSGLTALISASYLGHIEIVQALLDKGADINASANNGATALIFASANGRAEVVELLLKNGADVNAQRNDGATALMGASSKGRQEALQLLLENIADGKAQSNGGAAASMAAHQNDPEEIAELLVANGANVNAKMEHGETALMFASREGRKEFVALLLARGADVNAKADDGSTALMIASQKGHEDVMKLLVRAGANSPANATVGAGAPTNPNAGESGLRADEDNLRSAARDGNKEVVQLLLAKGVAVDAKNNSGMTALILACGAGHTKEIAELLLAGGADVNAKLNDASRAPGLTALMNASREGNKEVVQLLLAKGADVNAKMTDGRNALTIAATDEVRELLIKAGAK